MGLLERCQASWDILMGKCVNFIRTSFFLLLQLMCALNNDVCFCLFSLGDKAVAVNFSRTIYRVTEKDKYAVITLQALEDHTFSFSVSVSTRDVTASECQAVVYY